MVDQNIPLQETFAPEVAAALIDLAQLAQHTGSTTIEDLDTIADKMLERLLVLCSAQCGAVFLGVDERLQPGLHATHHKISRALALHDVDEETAHALLSLFLWIITGVKPDPELVCWLTYRLSLGEFFFRKRAFFNDILSSHEMRNFLPMPIHHCWSGSP